MSRIGLDRDGLAKKLGFKYSTIGNWCARTSTPNYETILKLVDYGITANELFGKELGEKLVRNSSSDSALTPDFDTPEFKRGVARAIEDLKKLGVIKSGDV